jgi:hypothetical protein
MHIQNDVIFRKYLVSKILNFGEEDKSLQTNKLKKGIKSKVILAFKHIFEPLYLLSYSIIFCFNAAFSKFLPNNRGRVCVLCPMYSNL